MRDAYLDFFDECISKEKFFNFGLNNVITIPANDARKEWEILKCSILDSSNNKNPVFIRSYGRNKKIMYYILNFTIEYSTNILK